MKILRHNVSIPAFLKVGLAHLVVSAGVTRAASTTYNVDFSGIPNGTPLSQHDTFFGLLHFTAGESAFSNGQTLFSTNAGYFNLARLYSPDPWVPGDPVPGPIFFHSYIAGSFSCPVTFLSLDTQVFGQWGFSVDFTGVDQDGHSYTVVMDPTPGFQTLDYTAPDGSYLTGFSTRWDSDLGPGQLFAENISFAAEVPETSSITWLFALALAGLLIVEKRVTRVP